MNLEVGKQYNVTVIKTLPIGAVVKLEDESTELVHISNIADCYVADVADFVTVGQEYVATCEEGTTRPIQLTFKPLCLKSAEAETVKKPTYNKRSSSPAKSIDEMIADANASYEERQSRYNKRSNRR